MSSEWTLPRLKILPWASQIVQSGGQEVFCRDDASSHRSYRRDLVERDRWLATILRCCRGLLLWQETGLPLSAPRSATALPDGGEPVDGRVAVVAGNDSRGDWNPFGR